MRTNLRLRLVVTALICFAAVQLVNAQSKFVTVRGKEFVTPDGKPFLLRGINLGNWLLPEGYMFKFKAANSPRRIEAVLNQLIGEDEARRFWKDFRNNYITHEDIKFIKQIGLNSIRVPFNYRLFVVEGDPQRLEGPGYEMLDRVINWSRAEGLLVILDMHGAPGGQTGDNIDDSNKPDDWDAIIAFAEHPRTTFEDIRKNRPSPAKVKIALTAFLRNMRLENCRTNQGYINAMGSPWSAAARSASSVPPLSFSKF